MSEQNTSKVDYLFEVSWEVCNKVGGIYTVISTKVPQLVKEYRNNYILIGPDVWKETSENPEFIEDKTLFGAWTEQAEREGLHIHTGRWNIEGKPVAILVDFTPFFMLKDKILTGFWERFGLDSISGGWDYVEPALFGYAAARVIESFYNFYLSASDKLVAHFHEWMTGGGILHLRDRVPQAATVFTTHATVLGRTIAGNHRPLYSDLKKYNPDQVAREFNVTAKFSLERSSAMQSDAFTVVSAITAEECSSFLGKPVDLVTPNGFDDSFVPNSGLFNDAKTLARETLLKVAEAVLNRKVDSKAILVVNSGRYEFGNKGIDLFIDALSLLDNDDELNNEVIAFITVPANHTGPRKEVVQRLQNGISGNSIEGEYLTHNLYDPDRDDILKRIVSKKLLNQTGHKVQVIFVPSYLNGSDGVINKTYYELLIGFDLSAFPSYYEPWGYTPLESIAFHVPTVTTNLAGFGLWMKEYAKSQENGVLVLDRNETNAASVTSGIAFFIKNYSLSNSALRNSMRQSAFRLSRLALWENLLDFYKKTYAIALEKSAQRFDQYKLKRPTEGGEPYVYVRANKPEWRKFRVKPDFPESLVRLKKLSQNLWWCWNHEARQLFSITDPELWEAVNQNPVALLSRLSYKTIKALEKDKLFNEKLDLVYSHFEKYLKEAEKKPALQVAYFSMEFGLHDSIQIYSGGLGVLAGDYLKEASDSNFNMIGVGLLYRYGYFKQQLTILGDQVDSYSPQVFSDLPLNPVHDKNGDWLKISIVLPGRKLYAKVWRIDVGRIPLYLLDTDISDNTDADRSITHTLYGGDWENRFKQELLLGVGGIRMLQALGLKPDLYHCNEGHAAFIGVERLRNLVQVKKLTFAEAIEVVRSSNLFTTHTPVPAGHDAFSEDILRTYIPHYADRLGISWEAFMNLGRFVENKTDEKFSMSVLAAKLSQEMNGVSAIHGRVSREMFAPLFDGYFADELYIGHVTNGVHYPTWAAWKWQKLYVQEFGKKFLTDQSNPEHWRKIHNVSDDAIWEIRNQLRGELVDYIREHVKNDMTLRKESPKQILKVAESLDPKALTIGFARRFATYKRAYLLFSNLDRLSEIVNNKKRPVQFIFAGKAHPADKAGQDLIRRIVEISRKPEFTGKIVFVENYDMQLGRRLVQGCDVWLNTPTRPLEASGTSGEKAAMNGVLNFSVLDGWWAEGYTEKAGWSLPEKDTFDNSAFQDELDAEMIYSYFEDEIIPLFYERDKDDVPQNWIGYIKNNIAEIAPRFTMKRMLDDYKNQYYLPMFKRQKVLTDDGYEKTYELTAWKRRILRAWNFIQLLEIKVPDPSMEKALKLGERYMVEVTLDLKDLSSADVGVEIIFGEKNKNKVDRILEVVELQPGDEIGGITHYKTEIEAISTGSYEFAFRIFPRNPLLPHRQDFNLVRWV
ncbi:MAG: alpha-glucan family phosphorylase [Bacteroidota bacterium]|nr:alpha-glucan family phosphorylase [Bacteroidota bacterium]